MKRLFIATLIALPGITASAAQPSGAQYHTTTVSAPTDGDSLTTSCWRNERTGDWEIGFFEDCAVYRSKFWDYKRREVNAKTGEADLVLTCGDEDLAIHVGKYRKGTRTMRIGGRKFVCSRLTTKHLPPYPTRDSRTEFVNNGYRMDTVTVSGWMRDILEEYRNDRTLSFMVPDIFTNDASTTKVIMDEQGRFTARVPILNTCEVQIRRPGYFGIMVLEPGKEYFMLDEGYGRRRYFMGDDVRMQNELVGNELDWEHPSHGTVDDYDRMTASIDSTLRLYDSKVDSLCDSHSLSERYRTYVRDAGLWTQAMMLGQSRFEASGYHLPANALKYARDKFWTRVADPITLHPEIQTFLSDYLDEVISDEGISLPFKMRDHLTEIAANEQDMDILSRWETASAQGRARMEAATTDEERQRIKKEDEAISAEFGPDITRILNSPRARSVFDGYWQIARMPVVAHQLDSIGAIPIVKDAHLCNRVYSQIDHSCQYTMPKVIDTLRTYVGNAVGIETIESRNDYYRALEERTFDTQVLRSSDSLQGISEGEALLKKILEQFKGKIVLLDIWGTWCGPCKEALSHSTEEYARLNKYDIAYVYLAKDSPTAAWENVIKEYNVSGDNVAHYNLPKEQQEAIEQYLGVDHWPTYKLFDRNGNMLNVHVDARNLDRLERQVMLISKE